LLISVFISLPAFASEESSYRNEVYSFSLEYPKSLKMKIFGEGYFDILKGGTIFAQASVEDDTFNIFIQEAKPEKDVFRSFVSEYSGRFRHANPIDSATLFRSIAPPHSGAFRHPPVEGRISDAG